MSKFKVGDKVRSAIGWKDYERTQPIMWSNEANTIEEIDEDGYLHLTTENGDYHGENPVNVKPYIENEE